MRRVVLVLLLFLAGVPVARAEVVAVGADDAALALAPDRTPNVAYVRGRSLHLTVRGGEGWRDASQPLPPSRVAAAVVGVAAGQATTAVLAEDGSGRWLALYLRRRGSLRLRLLVSAAAGTRLGVGGLTLDARGNPAVAYAVRLRNRKTYLRVVRCAARCRSRRITRGGFPASIVPPSAEPVLMPDGTVRVLETYAERVSAVIEWAPLPNDWIGQYVFDSALGAPTGLLRGFVLGGVVYSAWTQVYPTTGESAVLLTRHYLTDHDPREETVALHRHAALVDLAAAPEGLEAGVNDWVPLGDDAVDAGTLAFAGADPVELDGTLYGYAAATDGVRDVLLLEDGTLAWYRTQGRPSVHVSLTASPTSAGVTLTGRVAGATGGTVELYREAPRRLVARVPVGADGDFTTTDAAPPAPTLYRAVWRDPVDGLPYGSLLRAPVG